MIMTVDKDNISTIYKFVKDTCNNRQITVYSGWTDMVNPMDLISGTKAERKFVKEYPSNVTQTTCQVTWGEDAMNNEKFIRIVVDNEDIGNILIRSGMKFSDILNQRQIVIIDKKNVLKKLLNKEDDVFTVITF